MLPYKNVQAFEDFYDSLKAIKDNSDGNEEFGKRVGYTLPQASFGKSFKKIVSVESFNMAYGHENNVPKSFSTSTFEENNIDCYHSIKPHMGHVYEEQSTMTSLSPYNSHGSLSSLVSMGNYPHTKKTKFYGGKKKASNLGETDFRVKYKTEVCKFWAETGSCKFGDQCAFAHGKDEIREKQHISSNYKTKKCVQFHENGMCPYGTRCQFIHCLRKEHEIKKSGSYASYASEIENAEMWCTDDKDCVCMRSKSRARLACFSKVSEQEEQVVC